jgi:hypothetical protein
LDLLHRKVLRHGSRHSEPEDESTCFGASSSGPKKKQAAKLGRKLTGKKAREAQRKLKLEQQKKSSPCSGSREADKLVEEGEDEENGDDEDPEDPEAGSQGTAQDGDVEDNVDTPEATDVRGRSCDDCHRQVTLQPDAMSTNSVRIFASSIC